MLFSCVRSVVLFTYKWLCSYYEQSEMFLSNIFRHMVHTLIFRSGFRVLCSVFMTAINYIKIMKKKKQNVLLYMMSPKVVCFFGVLLLLLVTHSNFLLSPDGIGWGWPMMPSIKFEKPQVCLVWIRDEHNMDGTCTKCKMERKRTLGCPTVLLSWWYKWIEGVLQLHNF